MNWVPLPDHEWSCKKMNNQYIRLEVLATETSELKRIWEEKIEKETEYVQNEIKRLQQSALQRLRNEWLERLERREMMRKMHEAQQKQC
ncbi:protein FAM240B-like isoform X2 [Lissotriton helveticus]